VILSKKIQICFLIAAVVLNIAPRFYSQYRPVTLYVNRNTPMPAEFSKGLHMEEHGIHPTVTIDSPHETAPEKILELDEIRRVRTALAWKTFIPPLIDSISIRSPTEVLGKRTGRNSQTEYQIIKENNQWRIKSSTRSAIQN
jgi:hypothetical protein